jgi:hypothetical protein
MRAQKFDSIELDLNACSLIVQLMAGELEQAYRFPLFVLFFGISVQGPCWIAGVKIESFSCSERKLVNTVAKLGREFQKRTV